MITYRQASITDINSIAKIHVSCFSGYFITSLGEKLISRYYQCYFEEDNLFVIAEDNGKIIGFAMGYLLPSSARSRFERENRFLLSVRILKGFILFDKQTINRCVERLKSLFEIKNKNKKKLDISGEFKAIEPPAALLSIAVMESFRGKGVSSTLIVEFEKLLHSRKVNSYSLSVFEDNDRARKFYEKSNFILGKRHGDSFTYIKNI